MTDCVALCWHDFNNHEHGLRACTKSPFTRSASCSSYLGHMQEMDEAAIANQPVTRGEFVKILRDKLGELRTELRTELLTELRTELRTELHSLQQQILDIAGIVETVKARWGGGIRPDGQMAALERIQCGIEACAAKEGPWGDDD